MIISLSKSNIKYYVSLISISLIHRHRDTCHCSYAIGQALPKKGGRDIRLLKEKNARFRSLENYEHFQVLFNPPIRRSHTILIFSLKNRN